MDCHIKVSGHSTGAAGFSHPLQAQLLPNPHVRRDGYEKLPACLTV